MCWLGFNLTPPDFGYRHIFRCKTEAVFASKGRLNIRPFGLDYGCDYFWRIAEKISKTRNLTYSRFTQLLSAHPRLWGALYAGNSYTNSDFLFEGEIALGDSLARLKHEPPFYSIPHLFKILPTPNYMLFNSYLFLFVFCPIVLVGFHFISRKGYYTLMISWLVAASLFFYGWWDFTYLGLLIASIIFNYCFGMLISSKPSKPLLVFGVLINLSFLGYYKYAVFLSESINWIFSRNSNLEQLILPLAISFFTFQQITYLIDSYRGLTEEHNFLHYCFFVTFFPQLIAGPIVHHKEILPQISDKLLSGIKPRNMAVGITLFVLGLFKKVVLADNIAVYANPVFEAAEIGIALTLFEAWSGALAFTFQIYFDFSGYSDMAIGIARIIGIILPINFYSPYQAESIIEFWRKWHITLSRFLRDYIYIPLGGNRNGKSRRYINLLMTMLLGGLWHGAGWTFVLWGGLHGVLLTINHIWRSLNIVAGPNSLILFMSKFSSRLLTFFAVVLTWVLFKADTLRGAGHMYTAMFGFNGISLPEWASNRVGRLDQLLNISYGGMFFNGVIIDVETGLIWLICMLAIVWILPNPLSWLADENPALGVDTFLPQGTQRLVWKPTLRHTFLIAVLAVIAILYIQRESEFLYFQF